jgi:hypothetical protein
VQDLHTAIAHLVSLAQHQFPEAHAERLAWAAGVEALLTAATHAPDQAWDRSVCTALLHALALEPEPARLTLRLTAFPMALLALGEATLLVHEVPPIALQRLANGLGTLTVEHKRAQIILAGLQGDEYTDEVRAAARLASHRLTPVAAVISDSEGLLNHPLSVWVAPLVFKLAAHDPRAAFDWLADCTAQLIPLIRSSDADALLQQIAELRAAPQDVAPAEPTPVRTEGSTNEIIGQLIVDKKLLLAEVGQPHLNTALGRVLAQLADKSEPLAQIDQRRALVYASFRQRIAALLA